MRNSVLLVASAKGGVGKTGSTIELATIYKQMGEKVIVIDLDENGTLTKLCDGNTGTSKTIYELLHLAEIIDSIDDVDEYIEEHIQHLELFDLIPSSIQLSKIVKELCLTPASEDEFRLADLCELLHAMGYSKILIDNAPSRSLLLTMSYIAASDIVLLTECDEASLSLLQATEDDLMKLSSGRIKKSSAQIIGYILNRYQKTTMHSIALDELNEKVKDGQFVATLPATIKMSEVKTFHSAVSIMHKSSPLGRAYYHIAELINERIGD